MSNNVADWREGMPWSEEAEVFFANVIGDKSRSNYELVFDMARAMCEAKATERITKKWPYAGRVEARDIAAAITDTTGEIWSEEMIQSWSTNPVP